MAGFFDRIFGKGKAYSEKQTPKLACELTIGSDKYMLDEFDVDFDSDLDRRYVPLYAVFAEKLTPELESWLSNDIKRMDGRVKFYKHEEKVAEGAVFTLTFREASCVGYKKTVIEDAVLTRLTIAARTIQMLGQEF